MNERDKASLDGLRGLREIGVRSARFEGDKLVAVTFFDPAPPVSEREPGDEVPPDESGDEVAAAAEALANRGNRRRETP